MKDWVLTGLLFLTMVANLASLYFRYDTLRMQRKARRGVK